MTRTKISTLEFLADKDNPTMFFKLVEPHITDQKKRLLRAPLKSVKYNEIKKSLQQAENLLLETKMRMKSINRKEKS